MWQLSLLVAILASSISLNLQRFVLSKDTDPIAYSIVAQMVASVILLSYSLISGIHPIQGGLVSVIPNLVLMILLYLGLNIFSFKSISKIEISEFTILFSTRTFWTILMAILFLGESFALVQSVGTILLFLSVIIISYKKTQFSLNKGELMALASAACLGSALVNDAFTSRFFDLSFYNFLAFFLPAVALWGLYPKKTKDIVKLLKNKKTLIFALLTGVFFSLGQTAILLAYRYGNNVAQIGALNQLVTIVTVWIAFVFLKERTNLSKKIIAASISVIGAVLVGW